MNARILIALAVLGALSSTPAAEAQPRPLKTYEEKIERAVPVELASTLKIDNPHGRIIVSGTGRRDILVRAIKKVQGVDDAALREGIAQTSVQLGGDQRTRVIRTTGSYAMIKGGRWTSSVDYTIEIPRNINVIVESFVSELIRVSNLQSRLFIRNANGNIEVSGVSGPTTVETINGAVTATFSSPPLTPSRIQTVNGNIQVRVPKGSRFEWIAESVRGDILTSLPVQGGFDPRGTGRVYRGIVTASGPTITTLTTAGTIHLLDSRAQAQTATKLIPPRQILGGPSINVQPQPLHEDIRPDFERVAQSMLVQPPTGKTFILQQGRVPGNLDFRAPFGNIFVGEIFGSIRIRTDGGEVTLGKVHGKCEVHSAGGPIHLGAVAGEIEAGTAAGNVYVRSAQRGGKISTEGGTVQISYAGGPIELHSGGGDVIVRQARASVLATTKSGDVVITLDPAVRSEKITARTSGGNVILNVPPGFAATVDAIILTGEDNQHTIESDLPGLSMINEKFGNSTRIRAVGSFNGGGQRVEILVENGDIQIRQQ